MKRVVLVCLCLVFSDVLLGQYAYQDSFNYKEKASIITDKTSVLLLLNEDERLSLVRAYCDKDATVYDSQKHFKDNPFIVISSQVAFNQFINGFPFFLKAELPDSNKNVIPFSDAAVNSSLQGIEIEKIIGGLARYLVERVKEELSMAFFDSFADDVKTNILLKTLLPRTADVLSSIADAIGQFSSFTNILKEAFYDDLNGIWDQVPILLERPETKNYLYATLKDCLPNHNMTREDFEGEIVRYTRALRLLTDIVHGLEQEKSAVEIYENIDLARMDEIFSNEKTVTIKCVLRLIQIVSQSLRSNDSKKSYWISAQEMESILGLHGESGSKISCLYFGLLYEKIKNDPRFSPANSITHVLLDSTKNIKTARNALGEIKTTFCAIDNLKKKISEIKSDKGTPDSSLYLLYADEVVSTFKSGFNMARVLIGDDDNFKKIEAHFQYLAQSLVIIKDIYMDVSQKNYDHIFLDLGNAFNLAFSVLEENTIGMDDIKLEEFRSKTSQMIFKYGSFIAATLGAADEKEMQKVIESVALPPGSYSIKRNSAHNISINAFVGLSAEISTGEQFRREIVGMVEKKTTSDAVRFVPAVSAPIGIAISWGQLKEKCSKTLFFSIIDPGAIVARKFSDIESDTPDFDLRNIFSPGVFYFVGIPKTPLALGLGARLGPELSRVIQDPTTNKIMSELRERIWRYGLFVTVDLPILNLSTR